MGWARRSPLLAVTVVVILGCKVRRFGEPSTRNLSQANEGDIAQVNARFGLSTPLQGTTSPWLSLDFESARALALRASQVGGGPPVELLAQDHPVVVRLQSFVDRIHQTATSSFEALRSLPRPHLFVSTSRDANAFTIAGGRCHPGRFLLKGLKDEPTLERSRRWALVARRGSPLIIEPLDRNGGFDCLEEGDSGKVVAVSSEAHPDCKMETSGEEFRVPVECGDGGVLFSSDLRKNGASALLEKAAANVLIVDTLFLKKIGSEASLQAVLAHEFATMPWLTSGGPTRTGVRILGLATFTSSRRPLGNV